MPHKDINAPSVCPYCTLKMHCEKHRGQPYHGRHAGVNRPQDAHGTLERLYDEMIGSKLERFQKEEDLLAEKQQKKQYWASLLEKQRNPDMKSESKHAEKKKSKKKSGKSDSKRRKRHKRRKDKSSRSSRRYRSDSESSSSDSDRDTDSSKSFRAGDKQSHRDSKYTSSTDDVRHFSESSRRRKHHREGSSRSNSVQREKKRKHSHK